MTVSVIDPRAALVVIDLQRGIAASPLAAPVVARAATLAAAFREADLPVVIVTVAGAAPGRTEHPRPSAPRPDGWTDPLPELGEGIRITKHTWGAFHGTGLHDALRREHVTQVVLAGIATGRGVESTARAAHEHGYHVVVATDAVGDSDADAHDHAIRRVFPALGETGTTDEIIALLRSREA